MNINHSTFLVGKNTYNIVGEYNEDYRIVSDAVEYMSRVYKKKCIVFGARNHIGREVFDAKRGGCLNDILYGEDFEYRLIREKNR